MKRRNLPVFKGILTGGFEHLYHAGCLQAGSDYDTLEEARRGVGKLYEWLWIETKGSPCNGCPRFDEGRCQVYRQFHEDVINPDKEQKAHDALMASLKPKPIEKYPGLSLKKIAEKLGISKNEVQRRRDRGEL